MSDTSLVEEFDEIDSLVKDTEQRIVALTASRDEVVAQAEAAKRALAESVAQKAALDAQARALPDLSNQIATAKAELVSVVAEVEKAKSERDGLLGQRTSIEREIATLAKEKARAAARGVK
jgi:chromosome segregation ATPase